MRGVVFSQLPGVICIDLETSDLFILSKKYMRVSMLLVGHYVDNLK